MKNIILVCIAFAMLASTTSCKKGEKGDPGVAGATGPAGPTGASGAADARLFNNWRVVTGRQYLYSWGSNYSTDYVIINNDNTWYFLMQDTVYGFRDYDFGIHLSTSTLLCMYGCYSYSFNGDTLRLTEPFSGTAVLVKDPATPSVSQWVGMVTTALDSTFTPADYYSGDITYDGQNIWLPDQNYQSLYKVNAVTHTVTNPINLSFYPTSVEWVSGYLWVGDYNILHKINPSTGAEVTQSLYLGISNIMGIAWDNQFLWCNDGSYITEYNPAFNSIISQSSLPLYITGSTYANGYFYICTGNQIHKCTLSPFHVEKSYRINLNGGAAVRGIAYDGTNFWVTSIGFNYMLYKIV
jgi:hypothetical protein